MKAIATKLDNGYTLTIVEENIIVDGQGIIKEEKKQRLVYENKDALIQKLTEIL